MRASCVVAAALAVSLAGGRALAQRHGHHGGNATSPGTNGQTPPTPPTTEDTTPPPDSNEGRARALFEQGLHYTDNQQWNEAAQAFEQAYQLYPRPSLLFNLGLAHRATGKYTLAIGELERYLSEAPDVGPDERAQVQSALEEMRAALATVVLHPNVDNATLTFDQQPATAGENINADPGQHIVGATAPGYVQFSTEFTLARSEHRVLDVNLQRAGGGILSRWWFWTAVGVVVAGGVALTVVELSHEEPADGGTLGIVAQPR